MIIKTSIGFSQKELNGFCILTDKKISAKANSFLYVYVLQLKLEGIDGALNNFLESITKTIQ